jgi:hypothetical protein
VEDEQPFPEYAALAAAFGTALAGFLAVAGRRLPERISLADTVRIGLASYKREGHVRALGELVTCPHCIGLWAASGFAYSLVLFPRQTRLVTTIFGGQAVADFLNAAFVRLHDR